MDGQSDYHNYSIDDVIEELLDEDTPFHPSNLDKLSDLVGEDLNQFKKAWPDIPHWRRQALLEDLEKLFEDDTLLSFENICRVALCDRNPQIRFIALRCLQEYDVKDLVPEFIRMLNEDSDEELRALAASTLGKYIYLGELEALSKHKLRKIEDSLLRIIKSNETSLIQRHALESLGFSTNDEVPNYINSAFDSDQISWIISALIAMGRSCDSRWEVKVRSAITHQSFEIRKEAIRTAGELELVNVRPVLLEFLDDSDIEIRMAAVWALSKIGGSSIRGILENLIEKSSTEKEIDIIENALENLVFDQSLGNFDISDFEESTDLFDNNADEYL